MHRDRFVPDHKRGTTFTHCKFSATICKPIREISSQEILNFPLNKQIKSLKQSSGLAWPAVVAESAEVVMTAAGQLMDLWWRMELYLISDSSSSFSSSVRSPSSSRLSLHNSAITKNALRTTPTDNTTLNSRYGVQPGNITQINRYGTQPNKTTQNTRHSTQLGKPWICCTTRVE